MTQSGKLKMVRRERWKVLFDHTGQGEMYDIESDPYELHDLWDAPEHCEVRQAMTEELLRWTIRTEDDLPTGTYQASTL